MTSDERSGLTRRAVLRGAAAAGAASLVAPSAGIARADLGYSRVCSAAGWERSRASPRRSRRHGGSRWSASSGPSRRTRRSSCGPGWAPAPGARGPLRRCSAMGRTMRSQPPAGLHSASRSGPAPPTSCSSAVPAWCAECACTSSPLARRRRSRRPRPTRRGTAGHMQPQRRRSRWPSRCSTPAPASRRSSPARPGHRGHAPPSHVPLYGTVKLAFVHHSETPNGYSPGEVPSILLSIFDYHRYVRGYFDIAYNFAVDAFGRIWEARAGGIDLPDRRRARRRLQRGVDGHGRARLVHGRGAVAGGDRRARSPARVEARAPRRPRASAASPSRWRRTAAFYTRFAPGAHVSLPRVAGHRDGDETSCPGNAFYARLPSMRPQVAQLAGSPARATIAAPAAPVTAGTSVTVTGLLTDLASGSPLAGAPIELQQIGPPHSEQTIATLTTDANGTWSYTLTPATSMLLRALHQPAPAAVSDVAASRGRADGDADARLACAARRQRHGVAGCPPCHGRLSTRLSTAAGV